jgi:pimeloyl-ACP methyl ester carboxylesterase
VTAREAGDLAPRRPGESPAAFVGRLDAAATREVTRHAGGTMTWRSWGAGPPLVLLHGATGSWTHWILAVGPLARRLRVIAPDMPGFGDSDPPAGDSADALADAVASGLEALRPAPAPLHLAGFSFGGIVAGLAAARLGARVTTLVLVGPNGMALPMRPTRPLRRVEPGMTAEAVLAVHRENLGILMLADPARADDLAVHVQVENVRTARFKSGAIPASDALLRALPAVRARLAGIWGARDAFAAPFIAERRRVLAAFEPDLDFRVVEGAGHWVPYEAADTVAAALVELVGAATSRSRAARPRRPASPPA